jgi:diaminohydroxyphosphoribosylaminopyrimidine deaminase/5-amino-6-(5-phosphoribosylamino)uracil reductase
LDKQNKTIIFSDKTNILKEENLNFERIDFEQNLAPQILEVLYRHQIQSVIIEGGTKTIQTFIDSNLWDEARVFRGLINLKEGIKAPIIALKNIQKRSVGDNELILSRNNDGHNYF